MTHSPNCISDSSCPGPFALDARAREPARISPAVGTDTVPPTQISPKLFFVKIPQDLHKIGFSFLRSWLNVTSTISLLSCFLFQYLACFLRSTLHFIIVYSPVYLFDCLLPPRGQRLHLFHSPTNMPTEPYANIC